MIDPVVVLVRIALVIVYGAIIGIEREARHKTAGVKTNTLVALGACGFAMISNTFGPENHNPGQIAAAIVTGIGFIGAGVIIHRGGNVQGVTTAATLWVTAAIGVCIGTGHLLVGTIAFAGVLFVQLTMRPLAGLIARQAGAGRQWNVRVSAAGDVLPHINEAMKACAPAAKLVVTRRSVSREGSAVYWTVKLLAPYDINLAQFEECLIAIPGVHRIDIEEDSGQSAEPQ
jgi:putative Mg2+ transporter-C (MgtC) family protein